MTQSRDRHEELGNVNNGYGGGQGLGQFFLAYPKLCTLTEGTGPGLWSTQAPTPNPTAKFLPVRSMGGVSIFTCLEEKALGWRMTNAREFLEPGLGQDVLEGCQHPCKLQALDKDSTRSLAGAEVPKDTQGDAS